MKPALIAPLLLFALFAQRDASAEDARWWAIQPLRAVAVPESADPSLSNPIDAFIRAKLVSQGLASSGQAERRLLIRRVSFDLIGLPPTLEEVAAFVVDADPLAYQKLVDRLLASPRFGERWARHWMDAAHFAETHGHDQDRIREHAWPYRDYLIRALNEDKPYARFVEEQVAGDALFPEDPQATVALGFLAAGPWDESTLRDIREDTLDRQLGRYLDRDDMVATVMNTFTSTTVQCARCHDHKFDPISQRDYYALQAVFAGVERANRRYDVDPAVHRRRTELRGMLMAIERGDRAVLLSAEAQGEVAARAKALTDQQWRALTPTLFVSDGGATLTRQPDGSLLASGRCPDRDVYTISAGVEGEISAVRLEVLSDASLPFRGPGRQAKNGNLHLSEFRVLAFEPGAVVPREIALRDPSADFNQDQFAVAGAIDGNEKTSWAIHPCEGESHHAVFELQEKLRPTAGTALMFILRQQQGDGHLIGRLRLSATEAPTPVTAGAPAEIAALLAIAPAQRSDDQRATLAGHFLKEKVIRKLAALPAPSLVYAAAADFEPDGSHKPAGKPRPVSVLKRGDIRQPLEAANPGALSCISVLPARFDATAAEAARRVALAQWLTDSRNPLTWRSIVNRVWHLHFGRGLVATPNDFGKMATAPSHPELLDWLAVWLRDEAQGSLKALHRLIVTSATYRQTTASVPAFAALDADNQLLWRMNRTRLDAESVRDAVLAFTGQLDVRMGGPSDRQFDLQPGIHVTPRVDYAKFDSGQSAGRRRSVYRFLFRTLPDPFMDALDCPAGDQLAPARNASVTVQQALALWNSSFLTSHAELLAKRVQHDAPDSASQVDVAVTTVLGRAPTAAEQGSFGDFARQHGLANLCRVLLNSNEFLFLN